MLARTLLPNAVAAAAIACIAGIVAPGHALAQDAAWTVTEVTGSASIEVAGAPALQAKPDLAVSPGARITTADGGRLSLSNGASVMTLSPGTEIEIREAPEAGRTSIFQRIGVLMLEVERRAREHFEVETPFLAAVVKGTRFSVSVADAGAAVHVTNGMVEVSAPAAGRPVLVHPGQTATINSRAPDTLRLDGGRSQNLLPEYSAAAAHQQEAADSAPNQVIRRSIGDASIDISAATNGLVSSKTLAPTNVATTNKTAAADVAGEGTTANGSATGLFGGGTRGAGETATTAALGDAAGGAGNAVGGAGNAIGGAGGAAGGLSNANSGPGNAIGGAGSGGGGLGSVNSGPGNAAGGLGNAIGGPGSSAQGAANDAAKAASELGTGLGKGGPGS